MQGYERPEAARPVGKSEASPIAQELERLSIMIDELEMGMAQLRTALVPVSMLVEEESGERSIPDEPGSAVLRDLLAANRRLGEVNRECSLARMQLQI